MAPRVHPTAAGPCLQTSGHPMLFGGPDGPPVRLRRKDLALLVFLHAHRGASLSRTRLAALLWGDVADDRARHSLSQALSRLQRVLPAGALAADGSCVRLSAAALRSSNDAADGDEADGAFLDGFSPGRGAEEFDDWADRRRGELRRARLRRLDEAGAEAERAGDWRAAMAHGRSAVELDPFLESGHRRIMRAWHALGERNQALLHFAALTEWLRREIGRGPDPETAALAETLASSSPAPASPAPASPATAALSRPSRPALRPGAAGPPGEGSRRPHGAWPTRGKTCHAGWFRAPSPSPG